MKEITKHDDVTEKKKLKKTWLKCWKDLSQECIQGWIERRE